MALIACPDCSHQVSSTAIGCPSCGYPIVSVPAKWNPGIAALLSLVLPGAGQMYKGQVANGLCWFVLVILGYTFFVLPGLVMHFFCIIGATMGSRK